MAEVGVLLLPLALVSTRGGSEILIGLVGGLFLARCVAERRWSWVRAPWFATALAWWGWTILASVLASALVVGSGGWHAIGQAFVMGRYFVFAAALAEWLLREGEIARLLGWAVGLAAAWIASQCWQQYLLGTNIFGWPRWGDGALTGPFRGPRAGPPMVLLLFPAMLPAVVALLRKPGLGARVAAAVLAIGGVATMILIGQRMPALLTLLGLVACGLVLRRLRQA